MSHCVCPWWIGWFLVNPLRRLWQDPRAIVSPYVRPGMTVLEPGPGMGFFTLELAQLVGSQGRVVAVDVQPRMLEALRRRAARAGLVQRIETRLAGGPSLGIDDLAGAVDFMLAFAVVHELPDQGAFFDQVARALKPGGRLLISEPRLHVKESDFAATVRAAEQVGLREEARPTIRGGRSVLLVREAADSAAGSR
jgi:ubiquinone/menaquinone biosynthesis C-methylase UbiE